MSSWGNASSVYVVVFKTVHRGTRGPKDRINTSTLQTGASGVSAVLNPQN